MMYHILSFFVALLITDGVVHVTGTPSPDSNPHASAPKKTESMNADAQIMATMGPVTPNGCSKTMEWQAGRPSWDKDQISERMALFNNVWAASSASADSKQTVKCNSYHEGRISWTTSMHFNSSNPSQDHQVKSYSNVGWAGKPIRISDLQKFSASWYWSLSDRSADLVADVSFDIFTSNSPTCPGQSGGCATHEIMIWLVAAGGAAPAGSKVPGKTVKIGRYHEFEVWEGVVDKIPVISLVPVEKKAYTRFAANLIPLLQRELIPFGLSPSEYIATVGSGIEPFKGSATLSSDYSLRLL